MFKQIFILILSLKSFSSNASELIVWNVGQGQWITEVHEAYCLHYDLGGEKNLVSLVSKTCYGKQNILFLSHWDWDHISWAPRYAAKNRSTCLSALPAGHVKNWKKDFLSQIPICSLKNRQISESFVRKIYSPIIFSKRQRPNDLSQVLESKQFQILIPGDSTSVQEYQWSNQASERTRGLILGHHGSKTSTSPFLMRKLKTLKWAVASSRHKKYGHPHSRVLKILEDFKVPLLKTEDWGHLHFRN